MSASDVSARSALFPDPEGEVAETSETLQDGILPSQGIRDLIKNGHIRGFPDITEQQIQPASLDLRLGDIAYRVQASFLPRRATVEQRIQELQVRMARVDLTRTSVFEKGCVYIVPLCEEIELPEGISARANPKSSTGRLDIFTRLITDYGDNFERVKPGYRGRLYAEVASRTFTVVVRAGMSLNQLRFIKGTPAPSDRATRRLDRQEPLVWEKGNPKRPQIEKKSVKVSVNLHATDSPIIAYKAKQNAPIIDLANINQYEAADFWEIKHDPGARGLILEPGDFYILASKEEISVPPEWAAEMFSMDQDIGEFRIHYAGFFDPGFGYTTGDVKGTHAVLEVRAHEVPFLIEHGQIVGRLAYWPLLARPDKIYGMKIGSSYQRQGLSLSKHFKRL
jgi:dCTP deaminase